MSRVLTKKPYGFLVRTRDITITPYVTNQVIIIKSGFFVKNEIYCFKEY